MRGKPLIKNFLAGEIAPQLDGLVDAPIQGCRTLENFIVRKQGGLQRRPGTFWAGEVKDSSVYTRIIPFESTTGVHYIIELGNIYARFWKQSTHAVMGGMGSETEVVTPYLTAELRDIKYVVIKDSIYFTHQNHPVQRLTWTSDTSWAWGRAPLRVNSKTIVVGDDQFSWVTDKEDLSEEWERLDNNNFDLTNTGDLRGICWGNGVWIMVGPVGRVSMSYDGELWIPIDTGETTDFFSVRFHGSLFIATTTNSVWISIDGIAWEEQTLGSASDYYTSAYKPSINRYIIAGKDALEMYSDDGVTWVSGGDTQFSASEHIYGSCYGNETFVVVGSAGKISTGITGVNWIARTSGITSDIQAVRWIEELSLFVALGKGKGILTSPDAVTWTIRNNVVLSGAQQWHSICWSPELSLFCAVATDGVVGVQVMTSPDGKAWTSRTSASAQQWHSICWSPELSLFCAVAIDGAVGAQVMTSPDGIAWTSRTSASAQNWQSICWSPELSLFCAVAYDGAVGAQVMTSPDGIAWTSRTSASAQNWYSICWSPELSLFCAVATDGVVGVQVMTSPDGKAWTSRTSASAQNWTSICWSPELSLFCAVAIDGVAGAQVMTSPDGIAWTSRTSASAQQWWAICWSPELMLFCAVAYDGAVGAQVMTSPDGIAWTLTSSIETNQWRSICWSPELILFCAVATNGADRAMFSSDGVLWRTLDVIYDIVWDGNSAVICGSNGLIMASRDLITWDSHTIVEDFIPTFRAIAVDYLSDYWREQFQDTEHYPHACAFHEGRLLIGGSANDPNTIWGSKTNRFMAFFMGTFDDDGWDIVLGGRKQSRVLWMEGASKLVVGTDSREGVIEGGPSGITASVRGVKWQSTYGSDDTLQGMLVNDVVIFAQRNATIVRALQYKQEQQTPVDLTYYADHITTGGIKEWDFQNSPESILWAIRNDGTLLSMSFEPALKILAWARHTSGVADFESVAVAGGSTEDEIWFVIKRSVDGNTVRYLEYMDVRDFGLKADAHFVDCGTETTMSGTSVGDLTHIASETADVLINGNIVESHAVSASGIMTLTHECNAEVVHVGLPFDSTMQTTRLRTGSPWGENVGLKKMIPKVWAWIYETIGGKFGPEETVVETRIYTSATDLETDLIPVKLPPKYNDDGYIWVIQDDPLPMTLLALSPEVRQGDT